MCKLGAIGKCITVSLIYFLVCLPSVISVVACFNGDCRDISTVVCIVLIGWAVILSLVSWVVILGIEIESQDEEEWRTGDSSWEEERKLGCGAITMTICGSVVFTSITISMILLDQFTNPTVDGAWLVLALSVAIFIAISVLLSLTGGCVSMLYKLYK